MAAPAPVPPSPSRRSNRSSDVRSRKRKGRLRSGRGLLRVPGRGVLGAIRTEEAGLDGAPQVTSQRGVHLLDPGEGVADGVRHVLPGLFVTSAELADSTSKAIGRRELAANELDLGAQPIDALGVVDALGVLQLRFEILQALLVRRSGARIQSRPRIARAPDMEVRGRQLFDGHLGGAGSR